MLTGRRARCIRRKIYCLANVILWLSLLLGLLGTVEAKKKKEPPPESLAEVFVFYSEPPLAYTPGDEIEVRVLSTWDRDRIERKIREKVAEAGGNVVVMSRSYMKMDRDPQVIRRPGGGAAVWDAAFEVVDTAGWAVQSIDSFPGTEQGVECEKQESGGREITFAIYFSSCSDETLVLLDAGFSDPSSGESTACRSSGFHERAFFERLAERL